MKRILLPSLFLLLLQTTGFAQQGLVKSYYGNSDTLKSEINYSNKVREGNAKFYYPNGKLKEELTYVNGKVEGLVKTYNANGKLKETFNAENGKRQGPASLFDKNGNYIKDINFNNGMLMPEKKPADLIASNNDQAETKKEDAKAIERRKLVELRKKAASSSMPPVYEEENTSTDPAYFLTAEIMPEPVGGMKTIMKKLVYPEDARKNKIQGTVKIKAFIDQYGEVTSAEVVKGIGYGCDQAAKIAVYYTMFTPGLIKGKPVKVQMIIPIKFELNEK